MLDSLQQVENTFDLEMATEKAAEDTPRAGAHGMIVIVFNDTLMLAEKLGEENDCTLRYLSHINMEDTSHPFKVEEKPDEMTAAVMGTTISRNRAKARQQQWLIKFMTKFERKEFVDVAKTVRRTFEVGPDDD
eukprot:SAG31_NODE_373_length_16597_cov_21.519518_15_plen_133_part_00